LGDLRIIGIIGIIGITTGGGTPPLRTV